MREQKRDMYKGPSPPLGGLTEADLTGLTGAGLTGVQRFVERAHAQGRSLHPVGMQGRVRRFAEQMHPLQSNASPMAFRRTRRETALKLSGMPLLGRIRICFRLILLR
jgi:hypothetical protein